MPPDPVKPPVADACCEACALDAPGTAVVDRAALIELERGPRPSIARATDRRITVAGVAVAAGFLVAAVASAALPAAVRHGLWLPVHLALAGGAGTAVASALPFFVTTLAIVGPSRPIVRAGAIALIALGAIAASAGVAGGQSPLALVGVLAYLAGLGAVATAAFAPLRGRVVMQRRTVVAAYCAAIIEVAIGVAIVGMMLTGFAPVAERWALLKPAHAWLNVFGFLSVVVAATLVHLAPTVAGTRIVPRRTASLALVLLVAGPPLAALGFALGVDLVARIGALVEIFGATALAIHALAVWRDRGRWTTDPAWHRVTSWSLTLAPMWFLMAVAVASGRVLRFGADPAAWRLDDVAAPLAIGWVIQAMIGSWSQLIPAIGPGDPVTHARQRVTLGRAATVRVVALDAGVGMVVIGSALAQALLTAVGMIVCAGAILASVIVLVTTLYGSRVGRDSRSLVPDPGG